MHLIPSRKLIDKWVNAGGVAAGVVLSIPDPEVHRNVLFNRGEQTNKGAEGQLKKFGRIRAIQDAMVTKGKECKWLIIEQKPSIDPRPIDILNDELQTIWVEGVAQNLFTDSLMSDSNIRDAMG